jgi:hypothetical protein
VALKTTDCLQFLAAADDVAANLTIRSKLKFSEQSSTHYDTTHKNLTIKKSSQPCAMPSWRVADVPCHPGEWRMCHANLASGGR